MKTWESDHEYPKLTQFKVVTEEAERLLFKENCSQNVFEGLYEEVEKKDELYKRNKESFNRNMTEVKRMWKKLIDIGIVSSNLGDFRYTEHNISGPGKH